jgi:tRNA G46 methylase TrmB
MATLTGEFLKLRSFTAATKELNDWIRGAEAFTLLVSAMDSGLINSLRSSYTIQQIAADTGLDDGRINNILRALEYHGLVKEEGDVFTLDSRIKNMMKDDAIQSLVPYIQAARTRLRTLREISSQSEDYTDLDADDTLSMAQGIGMASISPVCRSIGALTGQTMPELRKRWQRGAYHLELGCGVGNSLFQILSAFPGVTAKGIEINASIAAEAQRRAGILGLADRVEVVHGNAAELKDKEIYDTAHWSQFFFPESCRADVLNALFSAMKPGGYVCMPLLTTVAGTFWAYRRSMLLMALKSLISTPSLSVPYINALLTSSKRHEKEEQRLATLQKVIYEKWGIPVKTAGELKSEVEKFGFRVLRIIPVPASQFSEARGWLFAERPK